MLKASDAPTGLADTTAHAGNLLADGKSAPQMSSSIVLRLTYPLLPVDTPG